MATGAAMLLLAAGCGMLGPGSIGQSVDDRAITTAVETRLAAMGFGTSTHVDVDTYDGTVYLSGEVADDDTKQRVETEARSVQHVALVVPNLLVQSSSDGLASPRTEIDPARRPPGSGTAFDRLLVRFHGLARIEGDPVARPRGPYAAYDGLGRLVATVYTIPMRELAELGADSLEAHRRIDHVTIYPVAANADVPDPHYNVVLWHVTRSGEFSLR
jgi:BON domain-containing protein